jgi:energy-coupling factor transporter ATP-binding protein EcfA2
MNTVGLTEHADVRVGSLSGGQRKRASIAVELLTEPRVFFLDEPTSGLDPATSADLIVHLRQLADRSRTVVFTTHSVADLALCDRILFMARGGRVGFVWTVAEALEYFEVSSVADLYRRLADLENATYAAAMQEAVPPPEAGSRNVNRQPEANAFTQWGVLTHRALETFVRNPLTLAILLGSPVLVVGMFAILFRPGAFDFQDPSPSSMVMIGFWIVFAAFFFGVTYGLLQICTERTIVRRERLAGLRLGAYVASKVTVLVPFLLVVIVAMLGVLRLLDRLPERSLATYGSMTVGLLLCAVAALGLGLLTSAAVGKFSCKRPCAADVVLSRCCSRCDPARSPHGEGGRRAQCDDAVAVGLRSHRSRPRRTTNPRAWRLEARAAAARVVRRRRHRVDRRLLAHTRLVCRHLPGRNVGCARTQNTRRDPMTPTHDSHVHLRPERQGANR